MVMDTDMKQRNKDLSQKKKPVSDMEKRIVELDVIFKRLYEDNISGKLSDERFRKLSFEYEAEQSGLQNQMILLRGDVDACFGMFVGEQIKDMEPLRYVNQDGKTVFSISPDRTVRLNHPDETFSIGAANFVPQLYWDAVDNGEIPVEYQYISR